MKFTAAQQQAIDVNQHNILVNAAAGSGKTAVLVERLFQRLCHGATLDSFIVITFTKLAASEMKERLAKRLHHYLSELDPESELYAHLTYVESQIPTSHISTIDAFCSFIVREYGYVLPKITQKLSLIDTVEAKQIDEETFLELSEIILTTEEYRELAEQYIDIQDVENQKLLSMLLTIVPEFSQVANHQRRYEQLLFSGKPISCVEELSLYSAFVQRQRYIISEIDAGQLSAYAYHDRYEADIEQIRAHISGVLNHLENVTSYESLYNGLHGLKFPRKPAVPKDEQDEQNEQQYKKQREQIKKQIDQVCQYFQSDPEIEIEMMNEARLQMQIFIDLAYMFYVKAQQKRLERGRVLFSDISQLAYEVLNQEEIKAQWRTKITEVLIDEYQDTTLAQEELFATFGSDKLFLVGDMKQAIYRFRQSDPLLFAEKNSHYREANTHTVIDLNQNFRSRSRVLSYINSVFEPLMDEHVGEMEYDDNAKLYFGLEAYNEENQMIDVLLVDRSDEQIEDADRAQAQVIVNQIKQLMAEPMQVFVDKGKTRPIQFSDIAILTRNNQSSFLEALMEVCQAEQVPFQKEGKTKFYAHLEVRWILAMLQSLNNPYDDIQFATVLKSPFGQVTMQQLYQITTIDGDTLYEKAKQCSDENVQCFFSRFESIQEQLFALSPTKIFREILHVFQFEYAIEMMPEHLIRKQNIEVLYELSYMIETSQHVTFSDYVRYLVDQIQQDQITLNTPQLSESADAVMIQTFHKSKGLEYPVVFVANTQKQFNLRTDAAMYKLKEAGIVRAYHQSAVHGRYYTMESILCKDQLRHESLSEEMRLFYVALTRAREKLYITGSVSEKQKEQVVIGKKRHHPYSLRIQAQSMLDWIMLSLSKTEKDANIRYYQNKDITYSEHQNRVIEASEKQTLSDGARKSMEWEDPMEHYQYVPLKLSVTELKKRVQSDEVQWIPKQQEQVIKPRLQMKTVSRAMIGTATHTLFEHLDFQQTEKDAIQAQITQLVEKKQLHQDVAQFIEVDKIDNFFQSEGGKMLCQYAASLQREVPFRMLIDAKKAGYHNVDTEILVQGVIDVLVVDETKKEVYIFDYKTDDMSRYETLEQRSEQMNKRYMMQADLYKEAISRIYESYEVMMYFITLDDTVVYTYRDGELKI